MVSLAVAADEAGWDGLFLWDHMWRPADRARAVGDVWVSLAAVAARTSHIRIGPMVVPLARRRPQKVARESVAIDHLSNGRLTMGVGLGVNTGGELERFGEVTDDVDRGVILDEALDVLLQLWSGQTVHHRGTHFTADGVRFLPVPVQHPRIPIWGAAVRDPGRRPLLRAAQLDGIFPVGASVEQVRRMRDRIGEIRGNLEGFDIALQEPVDVEPESLHTAGVTWLLRSIPSDAALVDAMHIASEDPRC